MGLKTTGFTNNSTNHFIVDAGAVYLNVEFDETTGEFTGDLLGATSGGNEFVVNQEVREIEVDGLKGRGKGLQAVTFMNPDLTVNLKELSAKNLATVIAGGTINADEEETNEFYNVLTSKGKIEDSDYIDSVALVGNVTGSSKPIVIVLYNVLSIEGLEMSFEDDNEVVVPVTFGGHYDETQEVPYKIYLPKQDA